MFSVELYIENHIYKFSKTAGYTIASTGLPAKLYPQIGESVNIKLNRGVCDDRLVVLANLSQTSQSDGGDAGEKRGV